MEQLRGRRKAVEGAARAKDGGFARDYAEGAALEQRVAPRGGAEDVGEIARVARGGGRRVEERHDAAVVAGPVARGEGAAVPMRPGRRADGDDALRRPVEEVRIVDHRSDSEAAACHGTVGRQRVLLPHCQLRLQSGLA